MSTFDHFAYGSNLSTSRLRARCPSARPLGVGYVVGRQLRFHKQGVDGTGKADAFYTGEHTDILWGVIYRSALEEKPILDACESLGDGYQHATVEVRLADRVVSTFLYQAMPHRIDAALQPADWYHQHVIDGAREHALPSDYQQMIHRWGKAIYTS
ncbi:gamma-glutamylcyclotransferase family protein [Roseimaritima ulvae]|uniref:AIG2-like family protein n=1 Tax=Roseimaritima ulvae TaxID=980254 RepID=A0A5B9QTB9_9BACT|nr:gamma-glutamylcyclotransferase family protein [Roseimaritima ulvae]QEG41189.1 hypothetical protein UC8_32080 [Roseimaritima ulvae]